MSITWLNPNIPITRGISCIPLSMFTFPKLNLDRPSALSTPIVAIIMPRPVASKPPLGCSPRSQPMEVMASMIKRASSAGPNLRPNCARRGPDSVSIIIPIVPPMKEDMVDVERAFPACPFLARGYPSRAVITAGESPGIFKSIALKDPPYIFE